MRGVMGGSSEVEGVKVGDATLCVAPFAGRPPEDPSSALARAIGHLPRDQREVLLAALNLEPPGEQNRLVLQP